MVLEPGNTPVPSERRERTMRTTASAAVSALGNDRLHKGINWASILGLTATAVLGYLADARSGQKQERIATGAATEIAVLQSWKEDAEVDLKAQNEQIVQLRLAVAKLQAAAELVAQGYGASPRGQRLRAASDDVQELLDASPAPAPPRARGGEDHGAERDQAQADRVQGIKKKLLE